MISHFNLNTFTLLLRLRDRRRDYMDMRVTHLSWVPHLPAILVTLSWDNPCCTHISDKKLCSSPPPRVNFFCVWHENSQKPTLRGKKIPLLFCLMWRSDEYCSFVTLSWDTLCWTHIPTKSCAPSPPPLPLRGAFFASDTQLQQQQQKLYFHDHKGIIVLQKLLI